MVPLRGWQLPRALGGMGWQTPLISEEPRNRIAHGNSIAICRGVGYTASVTGEARLCQSIRGVQPQPMVMELCSGRSWDEVPTPTVYSPAVVTQLLLAPSKVLKLEPLRSRVTVPEAPDCK